GADQQYNDICRREPGVGGAGPIGTGGDIAFVPDLDQPLMAQNGELRLQLAQERLILAALGRGCKHPQRLWQGRHTLPPAVARSGPLTNRHSPGLGELVARIVPSNGLSNGKSPCRGQEAIKADVDRAVESASNLRPAAPVFRSDLASK